MSSCWPRAAGQSAKSSSRGAAILHGADAAIFRRDLFRSDREHADDRSRRRECRSSRAGPINARDSTLPSWLILGGFGVLGVVLVAILGIVWMRNSQVPLCAEPAAIADVEDPMDDDPPEEPLVAAPIATVRLNPEEIYRRLLKSTVYVVAKSAVPT